MLPLNLVLPLLCCGCVQTSPSLGFVFDGLWLCSGFPQSWSCLCWAVVVYRLCPVLILALPNVVFLRLPPRLDLSFVVLCLSEKHKYSEILFRRIDFRGIEPKSDSVLTLTDFSILFFTHITPFHQAGQMRLGGFQVHIYFVPWSQRDETT